MRYKFFIYIILPLVLIVGLFILSNYLFFYPAITSKIVDEKKLLTKELTSLALAIIDNTQANDFSEIESKKLAIEQLRKLNYGESNKSYFWIIDFNARMLMHPYREDLEGKYVGNYKDKNGVQVFRNAIDTVKKDSEGYIEYYWQWQDDTTSYQPKITFVKLYEKWGWIVGTGVYINDIEAELTKFRKREYKVIVTISIFVFVFMLSVFIYAMKIEQNKIKAIQELKFSEEKFRSIFQESNDINVISDKNGFIIDINKRTLNVYGVNYNAVVGKTIFEMVPLKYHKVLKERRNNIEYDSLEPYEMEIYTSNKKTIFVEIKSSLINYQDETFYLITMRDISNRKQFEKQLMNAIITGEEKERSRIAKELHDGLGPYLSTIKFYFQWLGESNDDEKRKVIIEKGNKSMQEAITILREVSNNLNPHILTNYGLMDAIKSFIDKFDENEFLTIDFTPLENGLIKNHYVEVALYRIVIEFINNTIKHAKASEISIIFTMLNPAKIEMQYSDNGIGFNYKELQKNRKGLGLLNIENRINTLDGDLIIQAKNNDGFNATVTLNI